MLVTEELIGYAYLNRNDGRQSVHRNQELWWLISRDAAARVVLLHRHSLLEQS